MTKNEHVFVICCLPGVTGDIISGRNVKTVEGYVLVNFGVASSSNFQDTQQNKSSRGSDKRRGTSTIALSESLSP